MTLNLILFLILALISVASAVAMLMARNPVYSAIFLVLNFNVIALFYLLLSAPFLAMVQITVYAGAIMVLFLFVIMLVGGTEVHKRETLSWQAPVAIGLGVLLLAEAAFIIFSGGALAGTAPPAETIAENFGSPEAVGQLLFSQYLLPFEITSLLLLIAMVGAIVLTRFEKKKPVVRRSPEDPPVI